MENLVVCDSDRFRDLVRLVPGAILTIHPLSMSMLILLLSLKHDEPHAGEEFLARSLAVVTQRIAVFAEDRKLSQFLVLARHHERLPLRSLPRQPEIVPAQFMYPQQYEHIHETEQINKRRRSHWVDLGFNDKATMKVVA